MDINFWNNKRVLITGHTGFKGAWLAAWLSLMNARLCGIALDPVPGSLYNEAWLKSDIRANICDETAVRTIVRDFKPEIVFHLASQSAIQPALENPVLTYDTNVTGLATVLQAVCNCCDSVRAIVVVTSDKTYYGECPDGGFCEDQISFGGAEPYSGSKACQEIVVQSFVNAFARMPPTATARASNVIGGGDPFKERLIPYILDCFKNGKTAKLRNPNAVRPWQYILDCLSGYLILAHHLYLQGNRFAGAWNFGPYPNGMLTVSDIVKTMSEIWGSGASYEFDQTEVISSETAILRLNIEKSTRLLGWKPKITPFEFLRAVCEFEKGLSRGGEAQIMGEIDKYLLKSQ